MPSVSSWSTLDLILLSSVLVSLHALRWSCSHRKCSVENQRGIMDDWPPQCNKLYTEAEFLLSLLFPNVPWSFIMKSQMWKLGGEGEICHLGCDLLLIKLQCDASFMSGDSWFSSQWPGRTEEHLHWDQCSLLFSSLSSWSSSVFVLQHWLWNRSIGRDDPHPFLFKTFHF